ncbi:MAG TPA: restriction endonuclease [Anaerolineaceae bacterium]|nr:restriction endonuclease [Anaerolineaceae bacterium]
MAIPDFQTIMLPLLKLASDGKEHYIHDAVEELSNYFKLTEEEKGALLPSGTQSVFYNRVGWARSYMKAAKLLEDPRRTYFKITQRGLDLLAENPQAINNKILSRYPEFVKFRQRRPQRSDEIVEKSETDSIETPEEIMESAYQELRETLAAEVLNVVTSTSPGFFEKLVVELLHKMGYGGTQRELARAVGRHGDEGIDGVIDQDKLGLDTIYIQAKNWKSDSSIGRPEIQKFVGALFGQHARRGVFITTAKFTQDAINYAKKIDAKVILIDGERLAELMIDYNVGVTLNTSYEIKKIDYDFFSDEAL